MKNMFLLLAAAAMLLSGCALFEKDPHLLTAAHKIVAGDGEDLGYEAGRWHKASFPVPLDLLMLAVRDEASAKGVDFSFDVPESDFLADRFNQAAAAEIASGKAYDREAFRKKFIGSVCGEEAAPFIAEYFSILEQRHLYIFGSCGTFAPSETEYIKLTDIYDKAIINAMADALAKAKDAAKDTPFAQNVNAECSRFITHRNILERELEYMRPVIFADRSFIGYQYMCGVNGEPAMIPAAVNGFISDDRKALVLRMVAYENQMDKRVITGKSRDYRNAWKDDRFEIFILPEGEPDAGVQFVITSGGVLWDARCQKGDRFDVKWNSNAVYNQFDIDGAWRAELIIPFSDFGYDKVPEKPFLLNVYRFRCVKGERELRCAWAPIRKGANYQPEHFGKIIWEK